MSTMARVRSWSATWWVLAAGCLALSLWCANDMIEAAKADNFSMTLVSLLAGSVWMFWAHEAMDRARS